jgi:hypothetical protein
MGYENVGARVNGERPKSKKALKEAVRDNPGSVTFDPTSLFTTALEDFRADRGNDWHGVILTVTGPDPYTSRKWYATVKYNADKNTVVVS